MTLQIKELSDQKDKFEEDFLKASKDLQILVDEKDKMRQRIIKLKSRKGKIDVGLKTCKNCGKEFNENSNFNWSCHIHKSYPPDPETQFWWCCGRKGKDAKGCKV